jgi:hypothetical protein
LLQASLSQKIMLPTFYQTHLKKQLTHVQFILLTILLSLIQSEKQVRLERLARVFPYPITAESRRKLPRFLDFPQLTIALIWFPLITYWLRTYCPIGQRLSVRIQVFDWGIREGINKSQEWADIASRKKAIARIP